MNATSNEAVSKLVKLWENKNAQRAARGAALSTFALSLAACGGSSDAIYTQADLDEAVADAEAAQAAAVQAQADAEAALAALQESADATQADLDAAQAALDAANAALDAANAQIDDLTGGSTIAYTTSTTDVLVGTIGNDTITATAATFQDTDSFVDVSTTDSDTLTIVETASVVPNVVNVETINLNLDSLSALTVDAAKISGAKVLTITRGDVLVGGSTLTGDKSIEVNNVDASGVAKIVAGAGTTSLDINSTSADKAGLVVDASTVTGNVTVDGAATIDANASTGTVAVDAVSNTTATETAKATVINAAKAATVTTHADLTGSVTINAAAATTVTVNDAQGGATVDAQAAKATITVKGIDDTGATITAGTGTSTNHIAINIDGTTKTTDTASISAAGLVDLDNEVTAGNDVETLTLSGNGAAVTYFVADAGIITSATAAGTASVTLSGNAATFSGVTLSGFAEVAIDSDGAGALDASKYTNVAKISLANDMGADITVVDGQAVSISKDQTDINFEYATGAANLSITAADVNGASTAVGTLSLGAVTADAAATAVGNVTFTANDANVTATSVVIGAKQTLVLTGDEDYDIGAVTANAVNASSATGIIKLTSAGNVATVTTGSGNDNLTANDNSVHNINAGAGDDAIIITDAAATSQFAGGAGADTFTLTEVDTAYVVVGDAGNDTFSAGNDFDAVIVGGDGSDTLKLTGAADFVAGARSNFAFSSIEKVNVGSSDLKLDSAMFANNSAFEVTGSGAITIVGKSSTAGNTIDASGVTFASGATSTLTLEGNAKADVITGSVGADTINATAGDDTIEGGAGTDTYVASLTAETGTGVAAVINLGSDAITATEVLNQTTLRTAGDTSVAGNTSATTFNDTVSTNNASLDTLSNIENATGTSGNDYIMGSAGNNVLSGGDGADYINGGDGADTITGGAGNDKLVGGLGADKFVFSATATANGSDTITGFVAGTDDIDLNAVTADTALTAITATTGTGHTLVAGDVMLFTSTVAGDADSAAAAATKIDALLDNGGTLTDAADTSKVYFVIADDNSSAIYEYTAATGATGVTSAELTLMGTVDAILTSGDILFA